jgi:solute carrier family 25 protein 44
MTSSDTDFEMVLEDQKLRIIEWQHLNLWKFYPMALASSFSVRCALYPMSVVKSRLALQKQNNVYRGMTHAFSQIIKTEGVTALYRGYWVTLPQLCASFVYSTVYEGLRNVIRKTFDISSAPIVSALAGGAASTTTQLIFVPTDIVAQYMMIYNNPQSFVGGTKNFAVVDCIRADGFEKRLTLGLRVIRAVYKVDGVFGFYRGFFSSLLLYIPSSMVFWSTYYNALNLLTQLDKKISYDKSGEGNLLKLQAISGAIGGVTAAACTNPLEVLRIRIQVHRTGYVETFRRLMVFEGARVFTKGLAPRVINNGIYSFLIMLGYESVKRFAIKDELQGSITW